MVKVSYVRSSVRYSKNKWQPPRPPPPQTQHYETRQAFKRAKIQMIKFARETADKPEAHKTMYSMTRTYDDRGKKMIVFILNKLPTVDVRRPGFEEMEYTIDMNEQPLRVLRVMCGTDFDMLTLHGAVFKDGCTITAVLKPSTKSFGANAILAALSSLGL